ncbi:MAG: aminotransferase class I/II-fold pyridoxal phosphate-dependent enzyme [Megasphaera sp.]|nr:aminotransferase class I/II-fold pyridoxal phosphate-dependent enzyme [Megasphaera sp.]MCI1248302.1 aminotransferase class I/II-fold pyridoxal phosphate-dependent enzyme [Megasphaera sp.]
MFFLVGGTQTNATVIDALLASYQGVLSPASGHVSVHEAGAIELGGHKVLPLPQHFGKITAEEIDAYMKDFQDDANHDHMVQPGMVYISQPSEYGTLYSLEELTQISHICHSHHLPLYVDGARLAYALASTQNDVTLPDLARLCDAFYIGGTKCGALFGEAVVIPQHNRIPHFFTIIKQHGALVAKGRVLGIQFDELFTDDLYLHIGRSAIEYAEKIKKALQEKGYSLYFDSPTNQIFVILDDAAKCRLEQHVDFSFWEMYDTTHTVVRFATSWATTAAATDQLIALL